MNDRVRAIVWKSGDWAREVLQLASACRSRPMDTVVATEAFELANVCERVVPDVSRAVEMYLFAWKCDRSMVHCLSRARFLAWELGDLKTIAKIAHLEHRATGEAEFLFIEGQAWLDAGDPDRAVKPLIAARRAYADDPLFQLTLRTAQREWPNPREAADELETRADELPPGQASRHLLEAFRMERMLDGVSERAQSMLRKSVELSPLDDNGFALLETMLKKQADWQGLLDIYRARAAAARTPAERVEVYRRAGTGLALRSAQLGLAVRIIREGLEAAYREGVSDIPGHLAMLSIARPEYARAGLFQDYLALARAALAAPLSPDEQLWIAVSGLHFSWELTQDVALAGAFARVIGQVCPDHPALEKYESSGASVLGQLSAAMRQGGDETSTGRELLESLGGGASPAAMAGAPAVEGGRAATDAGLGGSGPSPANPILAAPPPAEPSSPTPHARRSTTSLAAVDPVLPGQASAEEPPLPEPLASEPRPHSTPHERRSTTSLAAVDPVLPGPQAPDEPSERAEQAAVAPPPPPAADDATAAAWDALVSGPAPETEPDEEVLELDASALEDLGDGGFDGSGSDDDGFDGSGSDDDGFDEVVLDPTAAVSMPAVIADALLAVDLGSEGDEFEEATLQSIKPWTHGPTPAAPNASELEEVAAAQAPPATDAAPVEVVAASDGDVQRTTTGPAEAEANPEGGPEPEPAIEASDEGEFEEVTLQAVAGSAEAEASDDDFEEVALEASAPATEPDNLAAASEGGFQLVTPEPPTTEAAPDTEAERPAAAGASAGIKPLGLGASGLAPLPLPGIRPRPQAPERRSAPRVNVLADAKLRLSAAGSVMGDAKLTIRTRDLGPGSAFIISPHPLPADEWFDLAIELPGEDEWTLDSFELRARVVRKELGVGYAVELDDPPDDYRDRVAQLLKETEA